MKFSLTGLCFILLAGGCTVYLAPFSVEPHANYDNTSHYNNTSSAASPSGRSDEPFQVIYSEFADKNADQVELKSLDRIRFGDQIHVGENGYLLMLHYSGEVFEYEGSSEIDIDNLCEKIDAINNCDYTDIYWTHDARFFTEDRSNYSSSRNSDAVARVMSYPIEILAPDVIDLSLANPSICLRWINKVGTSSKYRVQVLNILDEVIDEFEVSENHAYIDFSIYGDDPPLYLVKVLDHEGDHNGLTGVKVGKMTTFIPMYCDISLSYRALETAFLIEKSGRFKFAEPYYRLAADLSNRWIYQELYRKYKLRSAWLAKVTETGAQSR